MDIIPYDRKIHDVDDRDDRSDERFPLPSRFPDDYQGYNSSRMREAHGSGRNDHGPHARMRNRRDRFSGYSDDSDRNVTYERNYDRYFADSDASEAWTDDMSRMYNEPIVDSGRKNQNFEHQQSHSGRYAGRGPRSYTRSDEFIIDEVYNCMTSSPDLDATEIEIQVKQGMVTLQGSVESKAAKRLAEDMCNTISGVKDVQNNLRLSVSRE